MSGHSKWNNIKHKKEKSDAAKAKIFTKIGREIAVVVKQGGANPNENSKLKAFLEKPNNAEIKNSATKFTNEVENFVAKGAEKIVTSNGEKEATQIYLELFNEHAKQTKIAKWARNLLVDIAKLKTKC